MHEIGSFGSQENVCICCNQTSNFRLECNKFTFGWGSAPDLAGGAYSASDLLAEFKGKEKGR